MFLLSLYLIDNDYIIPQVLISECSDYKCTPVKMYCQAPNCGQVPNLYKIRTIINQKMAYYIGYMLISLYMPAYPPSTIDSVRVLWRNPSPKIRDSIYFLPPRETSHTRAYACLFSRKQKTGRKGGLTVFFKILLDY